MVSSRDISGLQGGARTIAPGSRKFLTPGVPGESGPRTLVSVFPLEQRQVLQHEGRKEYVMPAAEKGSFSVLKLHDTYAWCRNWSLDGFNLYRAPIPASAVADNLIHVWREGLLGTKDGLGPGIIICEGDDPTEAEIAQVKTMQEDYFRFLINEADALDRRGAGNDIHDLHRMAASYMGTNDRTWAKPIQHIELVACPACKEQIRSGARKCRWCQTDLVKFQAELDREAKAEAAKASVKA